ncbi:dTDP-4-dehydrorhamnose 3,5-epimerase [Streptomyces sp. SAI-208]|jgi:dTDP-4-dehydrorhamnose 3,5-epimerase|uniref:dTDP-4-dehydrorhamnose 3,5-epimerase n=1 Tax=unclassified Streptomyces TaxID=2593676 RepID=UPI002475DDCF|nr:MULTISPECIES: dTDP-4-dehydrorhamnose 3,5-epimerase [unclassified Streptomyces]MDH6519099.1 dTDP-4-dehydrorhamnose 3,5-epimerase [Streptomyces sp. SAI-090]MDH6551320.1 dTDP-4-dehydrorhamnose 3,5-epimerase [Streptomyces sp. SAI-041]MDH6570383.1 dTDP-4-dehydrorhamnose 3,5-epimerase [Streptomyces sp. SAI-117]MDH6584629.1 dTDP-4-dehydrorhamnose 3,5-epimerase [Streptomyces sp. SAI-133]MDH6609944.1 dTDP-4-dehydrorhamnose 3,5-epimerase [Streptomyces sp. SAI-208]
MKPLSIEGAWVHEPSVFPDERGSFHEWFRGADFRESTGHGLSLAQANCSVSRRGTLRGVHFADVPPSQAKYVKCVRGAVLDAVVDIRVGSPTYGQWELVRLDDETHTSVYLSEGLGHAFLALTDDATVVYLCSEGYSPGREHGIHPLDPELGIEWPTDVEPLLSDKDAAAPTLAEAAAQGLLPRYEDCVAYRSTL